MTCPVSKERFTGKILQTEEPGVYGRTRDPDPGSHGFYQLRRRMTGLSPVPES